VQKSKKLRYARNICFATAAKALIALWLLLEFHPERHRAMNFAALGVLLAAGLGALSFDYFHRRECIDRRLEQTQAELARKRAVLERNYAAKSRSHRLFI
jgi:uncharacterized membrane protein YwaF